MKYNSPNWFLLNLLMKIVVELRKVNCKILLAQHCFTRWRLSSPSVTPPAGRQAAESASGRAADTPQRAGSVTPR